MNKSTTEKFIKTYYDYFNARNWDSFLEMLSEDVVHDVNHGESEKGKDKFKKFMKVMDEHYSEQVENLVVFADESGSRASAEFFIRGKYLKTQEGLPKAKEQPYFIRVGAFFEIKSGKITRVTNYYNLQDWIKQVSK